MGVSLFECWLNGGRLHGCVVRWYDGDWGGGLGVSLTVICT